MWRASSWERWASAGSGAIINRSRETLLRSGVDSVYVLGATLVATFFLFLTFPEDKYLQGSC